MKEGELTSQTLALDISTAGLHELAAWCRSLGLPETGALTELRARLYGHYQIKTPPKDEASDRTIEIRSARAADYFTMEGDGDTMVLLKGGVVLVMTETKRSWTHEIKAREITFNQSLNLLSARGDIEYKLTKPEGEELFFGESLDVDLSTWTGTFLDGRVIRATTGSGLEKKFTFSANVIEKGEGDVSVFSDAVISSCPDYDKPHYSIRATKAWILGKSEWGLANAVLSVGEVPVLYLPFFYYTGEEIVFHPVIGTKDREGYFANTTVYLLGEKKAAKESISLLQLNAQDSGTVKRLVGAYLLSTDEKKTNATTDVFKLMLDAYTNLGILSGIECALSSNKKLPSLNLSAVAALTRNVYSSSSQTGALSFSPYSASHDWRSVWNTSQLFGVSLPIRFCVELGSSYQVPKAGLSLSLQFPFFTDPYVKQDFDARSEDMKWFSFLEEDKGTTAATGSKRDSLEMKAEATYTPNLGQLKPYVNVLSLSPLRTKLISRSRAAYTIVDGAAAEYESVDPARDFFAPEQWTMAEAALTLSGTLFTYPKPVKQPAAPTGKAGQDNAGADPPSQPRTPWYEEKKGKTEEEERKAEGGPGAESDPGGEAVFDPSGLFRQTAVKVEGAGTPVSRSPFTFSLGYTAKPSGTMDRYFASAPWQKSEDVDWETLYEYRIGSFNGGVTANSALYGSLVKGSLGMNYVAKGQEHYAFNGDEALLPETSIANFLDADYKALQDKLTANLSLSTNPLQDLPMWSSNSLSYNLGGVIRSRAYSTEYSAPGEPEYAVTTLAWNKEAITAHNLVLALGANPLGWNQTLTLTANLPPLAQSYKAGLSLKAWSGSLSVNGRVYWDEATQAWKYDDLTTSFSYAFAPKASLSDNFSYNVNEDHAASNTLALKLWDFNAALAHAWGRDLSYNSMSWVPIGEEGLQPSTLALGYSNQGSQKPKYFWKNRVSVKPTLSSNLSINFQQYTSSTFSFKPEATISIADFMEINFSSTSQNNKVYSYLVGLPGFETDMGLTRINPFVDLYKSFAFWNTDYRKASNFKLKGIHIGVVHHLDDWDLTLSYDGKSELNETRTAYVFNPYFTLNLAWKQIPEIKTDIVKNPTVFTVK